MTACWIGDGDDKDEDEDDGCYSERRLLKVMRSNH
jgi:hypothetical protein